MRHVLRSEEIARYCGVSHETVCGWMDQGLLKACRLDDGVGALVEIGNFLEFLKSSRMTLHRNFRDGSHRAIVVDDDANMAHSIKRSLGMAGFTALIAQDAFHAGVLLGSYCPTVMTLDIKMPLVSGFEIVKFVRASSFLRHTKILMISGLPRQEMDVALKAGADDFLTKPFSNEALVNKSLSLSVQSLVETPYEENGEETRGAERGAEMSSHVLCCF